MPSVSALKAGCSLSWGGKCNVLVISSSVWPRAPALVMARAAEMEYGEKNRLPSFERSWAYRSKAKVVSPLTTALVSAAGSSAAVSGRTAASVARAAKGRKCLMGHLASRGDGRTTAAGRSYPQDEAAGPADWFGRAGGVSTLMLCVIRGLTPPARPWFFYGCVGSLPRPM